MDNDIDKAYLEYQLSYIKRRNEVTSRLLTLSGKTISKTYKKWLLDAIDFINEEKQ